MPSTSSRVLRYRGVVLVLYPPLLSNAWVPKHRPGGLFGHSLRAAARKIQSSRRSRLRRLVAPPLLNATLAPQSKRDPVGYRSQQRLSKRIHSTAWFRKRRIHGRGAVPGLAPGLRRPHRTRLFWAGLELRAPDSRARPPPHRRRHFEIPPRAFSGFFISMMRSRESGPSA